MNSVDVIVGGPPCQGFSTVRQMDSANHGSRVRKDKRRYLYRIYLEYVAAFRPHVFVMESVLGIQSAAKGKNPSFSRWVVESVGNEKYLSK